nr:hypothetical protein [uncultured Rhodoferax sp.]
MTDRSVVVMGLPGSGKTTFLAALWHLVTEGELDSKLTYVTLKTNNVAHLNKIAEVWRLARKPERTSVAGDRVVSMILKADGGTPQTITFPDVAGEAFLQMWEERECDDVVATWLKGPSVLFFIHADTVDSPHWVIDETLRSERLGLERGTDEVVQWSPRLAPTQVQVTDLLQSMQADPLDVGPRRLAIVLSAWDKVAPEGMSPEDYLRVKLPLLHQFLKHGFKPQWEVRVYGVSAQGGDYDEEKKEHAEAMALREVKLPSKRIRVAYAGADESHDLTEPLQWLLM